MFPIPTTWLIAGAVAASGFALAGVQTVRLHRAQSATVKRQSAWDAERITLLTAAVTATAKARDTETRWQAQQQEADHVAQKATDAARADAAAARTVAERLRQRATQLAGSCSATPSAGVPSPGAPASNPGDLLADMQRRIDEAAGSIAQYADEVTIARQACEASWPR